MKLDFAALEAEITRNETVDGSAKLLMERLFADVEANKTDPAALQALVDRGRASNDSLAAAVLANTPAAEPPVEVPPDAAERARRKQ